jgi:hypothetical protein
MSVPPVIVDVSVGPRGASRRRWPIPVVLLWPLLALVWLLALVVAAIADAVLQASGARGWRWTEMIWGCAETFAEARGLEVSVDNEKTTFDLSVR